MAVSSGLIWERQLMRRECHTRLPVRAHDCLTGSSRGDTQSACRFDRTYDEESLLSEGSASTSKGNIWYLTIAQVDTTTSEDWRGLLLIENNGNFQRIGHCREYPNHGELGKSVWANVERRTIELI